MDFNSSRLLHDVGERVVAGCHPLRWCQVEAVDERLPVAQRLGKVRAYLVEHLFQHLLPRLPGDLLPPRRVNLQEGCDAVTEGRIEYLQGLPLTLEGLQHGHVVAFEHAPESC
jgi:hypothetical protein